MSFIQTCTSQFIFPRGKTDELIAKIAALPDPAVALAWRPGPGRAHIGWQLMHVGVTELIVATERLATDKPLTHADLRPRFRNGSVPDDDVPTLEAIKTMLVEGRRELLDSLSRWTDDKLDELPMPESKFTLRGWLGLIPWHEGHHHGQAHITLNLFKAAHEL